MRRLITGVLGCILISVSGCSSVPGDAALRSGHPEQAANLYRRGADQGDASAALRLGLLIDEGKVSATEYGEAGSWFKKACALGNSTACHNVGVAYEEGKNGLVKDYIQAWKYYLMAATRGYMQSQYNLASLYSNSYIAPNDVEGLKWILIAQNTAETCRKQPLCQWILDDPPRHRQRLERRMSNAQIQEAHMLATQWKASE